LLLFERKGEQLCLNGKAVFIYDFVSILNKKRKAIDEP
jgi:hypothetical protein